MLLAAEVLPLARYALRSCYASGVEFGARMINIDGKQIKLQVIAAGGCH